MAGQQEATSPSAKRRRGLGIVTPNACAECRKKRAKCDGQTPCGRCASRQNAECIYEIPIRLSKESMRSEIENLRSQQEKSDRILSALVTHEESDQVLHDLRHGATVESIARKLSRLPLAGSSAKGKAPMTRSTESSDHFQEGYEGFQGQNEITSPELSTSDMSELGSVAPPLRDRLSLPGDEPGRAMQSATILEPPKKSFSASLGNFKANLGIQQLSDSMWEHRAYGQGIIFGADFNIEGNVSKGDGRRSKPTWTTVINDQEIVNHLLALYFCWEYPTFASLSKEHFLQDYRNGKTRYCSPLLVNSILSIGCWFSSRPGSGHDFATISSIQDQFFEEAERLLEAQVTRYSVTTVQAMGLMALHQARHGRLRESVFLACQSSKIAVEMGLHLDRHDDDIDESVRRATFWGACSLDENWSLFLGRLPQFSRFMNVCKPEVTHRLEISPWVPYTDDGTPTSPSSTQTSNIRTVYRSFCELCELIHGTLYAFYSPSSIITSHKVLDMYNSYIKWYDSIPTALRLGHNFTPTVLFHHIQYHFAILLLFRPFLKLNLAKSHVSPHDVCLQASDAIHALLKSYSELYTLRYTPSFIPYIVMTSTIVHLYFFKDELDPIAKEARRLKAIQGWRDLGEMKSSHNFAGQGRDNLICLDKRWKLGILPDDDGDGVNYVSKMDISGAPEQNKLTLFYTSLEPAFGWSGTRKSSLPTENAADRNYIAPDSSKEADEEWRDNPLFNPFPFHGVPFLGADQKELQEAGFEIRN